MAVAQISSMQPSGSAQPDRVVHEDASVKWALWAGLVYLCIFGVFGVITAIKFMVPDLFWSINYMSWSRIRPVHVQGMVFGWLVPCDIALFYYMIPRLCGVKLAYEWLGKVTTVLWTAGVLLATYCILNPTDMTNLWFMTKGKEYEEYPPVANILMFIAWAGIVFNILATFARRRYKQMYAALWYAMGCLLWTAFVFVIGNWPGQLLAETTSWQTAAFKGMNDANINWFYGHSLVGLIATPAGLAIAYYFLPKAANAPLYSHKLSLIGFWTLGAIYIWNGAHHMIYGPIPYWLQTVATIFSFLLFIPVFAVITNFFGTIRGEWHQLRSNVALKFIMAGTVFYLLVCIQGPTQALRALNAITHFTDWVIGHAHMALFGTFTFFAYAGVYYAIPRVYKKPLYSEGMAEWHFWLSFIGFILFSVALWVGGFMQGMQWQDPEHYSFISTVTFMKPFWHVRAAGGVMMLIGMFLFTFNIYKTATVPAPVDTTNDPSLTDSAQIATAS